MEVIMITKEQNHSKCNLSELKLSMLCNVFQLARFEMYFNERAETAISHEEMCAFLSNIISESKKNVEMLSDIIGTLS